MCRRDGAWGPREPRPRPPRTRPPGLCGGQMCGQMCRQRCRQAEVQAGPTCHPVHFISFIFTPPCYRQEGPDRRRVPAPAAPAAGGPRLLPPPLHLPLDTIFKTFNIKVKFIILDPEKHFVCLRSSRCKQSTTGTKPAPRRRRPRLWGQMADEETDVLAGTGTGRVAGGPLPVASGLGGVGVSHTGPAPCMAPPHRSPLGANSTGWEWPDSRQAAPGWRYTRGSVGTRTPSPQRTSTTPPLSPPPRCPAARYSLLKKIKIWILNEMQVM